MLIVDVAHIPPEGLPIHTDLDAADLHVQGEENFDLRAGGTLEALLERGDEESVHVRGHVRARLNLQCGRCLEPYDFALDQDLDLFYLPHRPDQGEEDEDEVELSERDMVVSYYHSGRIDLGDTLREQLFLTIPMRRLCREECQGLCPSCGVDRNQAMCQCAPEDVDPRLVPLRKLLDRGSS